MKKIWEKFWDFKKEPKPKGAATVTNATVTNATVLDSTELEKNSWPTSLEYKEFGRKLTKQELMEENEKRARDVIKIEAFDDTVSSTWSPMEIHGGQEQLLLAYRSTITRNALLHNKNFLLVKDIMREYRETFGVAKPGDMVWIHENELLQWCVPYKVVTIKSFHNSHVIETQEELDRRWTWTGLEQLIPEHRNKSHLLEKITSWQKIVLVDKQARMNYLMSCNKNCYGDEYANPDSAYKSVMFLGYEKDKRYDCMPEGAKEEENIRWAVWLSGEQKLVGWPSPIEHAMKKWSIRSRQFPISEG